MQFIEKLAGWLWGTPLIVAIIGIGVFFTIFSGFFQFRFLGHIFKQTFGKMLKKDKDDDKAKGMLAQFEAVSAAVGGSVGVGNIGGVSTAVAMGGPGAVFWMWISALLGMIIKMVEVTLAVYYRSEDEKGNPYGGPTYYMEKGLGKEKGFKGWSILALVFGIGIWTTFPLGLSNYTVSEAVSSTFNFNIIVVSIVYAVLVFLMTFGGIKKLGKIASRLVPFMCVFYVLCGLLIMVLNITEIPSVFSLIIKSAFTGHAAVGGFVGVAFSKAIRLGMARSVYSNEAGWGTSPMVHATAKVDHPVKQGLWGTFEVFVDTIIVCSITALVIIITGQWSSGLTGASLTLSAFEVGLGSVARIIITLGVFIFGLTTTSGWYIYYEVLLRHAFKNNVKVKDTILNIYKYIYPIQGPAIVIIALTVGLPGGTVWLFADICSAIPTFINVIVLLFLSKKFFELLKDYKARYLNIGKVNADFKLFYSDTEEILTSKK